MTVLTLPEVKSYLNITVTTYDTALQAALDGAVDVIEQRVGPLSSTTVTQRAYPGDVLVLNSTPVISLTSVTPETSTALTVADLYVDPRSGVICYLDGSIFSARYYTVVYQAGRSVCPDDLKLAVLELVRHLWSARRGPTDRSGIDATAPGAGYLMPYRVQELLEPYLVSQLGFA